MATNPAQILGGSTPSPLAGSSSPTLTDVSQIMNDAKNLTTKGQVAADKAQADISSARDQRDAQLGEIGKARDELGRPPTFEAPPAPHATQTSPQQAWGSAAMLLAM